MQFLAILALAGSALAVPYATGFGICPDGTVNACCDTQSDGNIIAAFCHGTWTRYPFRNMGRLTALITVDAKTKVTDCGTDEKRKCCPKDGKVCLCSSEA
ncbi:hypothetical protein Tdes44962_MAKER04468 [Teratosphaeria destructans]|uniref:Hydrophobin n=1 Tax=Teratosphaeria destructans TaxID=418781 RepID=A0A9W7W0B6_9PEZI|nr:hypothetical protein Tdes44962_MAKER04468 [Teratosphaeria destructans]